MAVNSAFHTNNVAALATEQNLYKNLVAEVIQIYGHDVHYLDRTLVAEDTVFGEDTLSKFRNSAKIEMYVENSGGGYAGERELMTKFGLQDLSEITFVVAKHRFQELTKQFTIEDATDTDSGGSIYWKLILLICQVMQLLLRGLIFTCYQKQMLQVQTVH